METNCGLLAMTTSHISPLVMLESTDPGRGKEHGLEESQGETICKPPISSRAGVRRPELPFI
jgi:hypothetical protein